LKDGDVVLLENTRFHAGEEKNDSDFAKQIAKLGDIFVNDAFSAAHRAHASTVGIANLLPNAAGRSMQKELAELERVLGDQHGHKMAVIGGAKISTKIEMLENLVKKVDVLVIGGAMANTFFAAAGLNVGKSLYEASEIETANRILDIAKEVQTEIVLPTDVVVAKDLSANTAIRTVSVAANDVGPEERILDVGPASIEDFRCRIRNVDTLVWNGPMGAFEVKPFDQGTTKDAQAVAERTQKHALISVAGGGDTAAALSNANVAEMFTYVSTAGGAFLEWLEGKTLPGVEALEAKG
jgi:phosphoglycerate kinase